MADMGKDAEDVILRNIAGHLGCTITDVEEACNVVPRNVRTILLRQGSNTINPTPDRPICQLVDEAKLVKAVRAAVSLERTLFTLARIYDECHVALCKAIATERKTKPSHLDCKRDAYVDLNLLTAKVDECKEVVDQHIILKAHPDEDAFRFTAVWEPISPMSFDMLPRLPSLSGLLPGEQLPNRKYAGLGGGGGSDIISASLLGRLLQRYGKQMDLLISTRTWNTGSQGQKGSRLGVKREVYNHDGPAHTTDGRPVAGTFRIRTDTTAEGRDLEAIPLKNHSQIFIVLDQGASKSQIPDADRENLEDQFDAVLAQDNTVGTVLIVDTGGDVFGADESHGTPDQDFRVQQAMNRLSSKYNLVTAVVAPGVDAPRDAPQKSIAAGGMVYKPTEDEKAMLLDILANEYKMDGSDSSRFGKTTLALQARLRGVVGWTSLNLPTHVVDTWVNPWSSFVYIRECMSDIIFMPTTALLPLIEPKKATTLSDQPTE